MINIIYLLRLSFSRSVRNIGRRFVSSCHDRWQQSLSLQSMPIISKSTNFSLLYLDKWKWGWLICTVYAAYRRWPLMLCGRRSGCRSCWRRRGVAPSSGGRRPRKWTRGRCRRVYRTSIEFTSCCATCTETARSLTTSFAKLVINCVVSDLVFLCTSACA